MASETKPLTLQEAKHNGTTREDTKGLSQEEKPFLPSVVL